ncbi:DUF3800 domain-containing protein [Photobacterium piscicola]|uniref:DUF3800 domain-containing protein n=1 Tax=Photobacterium piscicola TaxID=1378299 RepID=UPI002E186BFF|nr:DUF3800 domain-containing protein [Photobacterium piscicola]
MHKKYYIDESGNTGDLLITEGNTNFSSQEYFTLACIGLETSKLSALFEYIEKLKQKYKIQSKELKFSKIKGLFGKKIGFMLELTKYIEESDFIIEIVDKKYIVSTNIVNCLINPPYFQPKMEPEQAKLMHLELSQWVYDYVPEEFFIKFTNASRVASEESLKGLFDDLLNIAKMAKDPLANTIFMGIEESLDDFYQFKQKSNLDREAYTYFFPLPDLNKRGEVLAILPYIGSFSNIHARLNYLVDQDLSNVVIIHDNQSHFDDILKYYHENAINTKVDNPSAFKYTNFNFTNQSNLEFKDDKEAIGLQVADLYAGFINKAVPYLIRDENSLTEKEQSILLRTLASLYFKAGVNFVLPKTHNDKLFDILNMTVNVNIGIASLGFSIDDFDEQLLTR